MAVFKATKNRRKADEKDEQDVFKATSNRSADMALVKGWENNITNDSKKLNEYVTRRSEGGQITADEINSYRKAADRYKTNRDRYNAFLKSYSSDYDAAAEENHSKWLSDIFADMDSVEVSEKLKGPNQADRLKILSEQGSRDIAPWNPPEMLQRKSLAEKPKDPLPVADIPLADLQNYADTDGWLKQGAYDHRPKDLGDWASMTLEGGVSSALDFGLRGVKGFAGFIEGIGDKGMHITASALDAIGDEDTARDLRESAKKDVWGTVFDPALEYVGKDSFLGEKSRVIPEGLGQIAGIAASADLGSALGKTALGSTKVGAQIAKNFSNIAMFESSSGQALNEAYDTEGKTDLQRWLYAEGIGAVEAGSEALFGGLGRGINALGANRGLLGLDDYFAQKLTSKIANRLAKNGLQWAVKSSGEGVEEVLAGLGSAAVTKFTGMSDESLRELIRDENLLDAFGTGMLLSAIAQSGGFASTVLEDVDYVTGRADIANMAIQAVFDESVAKAEADGKVLTNAEKNELWDKAAKMVDEGMSAVEESFGNSSHITKAPGVYTALPGKNGSYEISHTAEDGVSETVELDSFSKSSPEYKIFRAAEDAHMTPAVAAKLVNDYTETGDINNYIDEAVYVSAAAKAGTSYEALSKGAGMLSEDVRRAVWEDGRIYSENKVKARQAFLNEVKTKASGNILAGRFNKTDIEGMKLNRAQQRAVDVADALSGLGFNIRMVKDINGNRKFLGYYDKKTGDIVLSVNARAKDVNKVLKTQLLPTLSHEVTHSMKNTSPEIYAQYSEVVLGALYSKGELDGIVNREFNRLRDSGRYEEMSDSEIYDAAYDEIVARASEDMLADPKAIEKICRENRTVGEKILEAIDRFISTLKDILSGKWEKSVHLESEILRDMQKEYETARDLWVKALADTAEARTALSEAGDVVREDGTPVASGFDSGEIQLNEATYEEEGRAVLEKYLNRQVKSKKLSRADADDILNNLDRIYDTMKTFAGKYAPYAAWAEAKVIRDGKGKPVFSVVTPNGDYSMNIDFSLVCKKRRMLDAVFNRMIERGLIDDFSLGKEEIVKINNIIKEHNFEIACALCFVDAKRFRQAGVADSFVEIYNGIVNEITPDGVEVPYFNFGGNKTLNTEGKGLDGVKVDNSVFQRYINEYGEKSVEGKVAKHLRDYPADRKLLHRGDFLSTAGFDAVKRQNPEILSLFNSKKGSGGPKSAFSDTQYLNEIIASRTFNAAKAFAVGGVRVQSFSDYIPRLVFDYCQMVGDLAAKRLPAHAYSKEDLFVKQFGKTGIKINMSLIPKIVDGGVAPGLDADGNYAWADESFDFDTAKKIQNADGYTDNCGTICVGVSREHILKLLGDPDIRMVIPYHKSGLNPIVAQMNKIAEFKDYTNEQNTRYTNKDGTAGSKLSDEDVKSQPNVNALMQKGMTAKEAAQAYLDWCDQKGYTPKFDEFAGDENYYKLLIDFVCYNKNGDFVPQGAVKMNFPNAEDKFGSMAKLIESGLEADAVTQYRQNKELDPIVDEITEVLGSDLQFNEALDDELTMREVLTGALEGAALTEADEKVLERYRRRVKELDGYDERLREVNREIKEISLAKGKRDTARLSELKSEKAQLEQDLKRADRKLLELSSTEALKNLFDREAKRLRREKSEALRAATKEARRMSDAELKEAVKRAEKRGADRERMIGAFEKAGLEIAHGIEKGEIKAKAAKNKADLKEKLKGEYKDKLAEEKAKAKAKAAEDVYKERWKSAELNANRMFKKEAEIAEIRRRAAERELKDRTRRERLDVEKRIRRVISYVTSQTDDKNVKQGLRGVVADFAHAILSNNAAYTQSEMTRMREKYEEIAKAGEGVEFIHRGAYDFDIFEELKNLEGALKGRAWRDLTTSELGTVDRVTRNVMHMIRLENRIFRNGKGESRVKIGEACERAIAECASRRGEKTTPKGKVGQAVQRFGEAVDGLIVTGNLMPVYYFDILGGEFEVLYNDLVDGQNKWARIVEDSTRKADEIKEKYAFNELTKGETVFTTDEGVSFEMTVREAMYFYAAFKRETLRGDTEHYLKGGIASDKIVAKAKGDSVKRYRSGTVRLSGDDAAMILDSLSAEQKAFADELVAYLSTDIARYGNETSMDLYGIEKFGDEYYIPYRVSGDARYMDPIEAAEPDKGKGGAEAKIKHTGMTNAIQHGAGNAMEQADIMEVFTKHCVEMANYAAFAVPIENIGGVLNFRGADGELLRAEMRQKLGDNMTSYFDTFIRDMNGGVKTTASGIEKFLSLQKKASVAASLSTVVQQPTAMFRAMVMIDPKYFVTVKGGETMQGIRASWDEMKQYAPGVTVVKDMGKFDIGSGVSAAEYISGDMTFGKAVDKVAGFAAEWADKLTWIHIWKACKAEAKAKGLRGEELLTSAGKRFTDVINRTQVYDSTLVRSENMRSRNALMKPFTAFKAEPTVTLNVMSDAVRSKSPAKIARTASALLASTIVNNALRALVYAGRDDDEEKGYLEKYGVEFSEGLVEDMMLWNYVPFVSDLASITRGFKSKRMETQLFESVYNSFNSLWEEEAGWREWATFVGDVGNFAGLPVKNVIRDFVMMPMNIANSSDNSIRGAWYAAIDTLGNSTTGKNLEKIGISITNTDYDGYVEALEAGDAEEAEKIFGAIIEYKMFKARRKAEAEGEEFYEDEARDNAISSVKSKTTEHLKGNYEAYLAALNSGNANKAAKEFDNVSQILTQVYKLEANAKGKKFDEKEIEKKIKSAFQSRVTEHFKPIYISASEDERTRIREILRGTKLYKKNIRTLCKEWLSDD